MNNLKIRSNSEIDDVKILTLKKQLFIICKNKALKLLSKRDYSEQELTSKLKQIANLKIVQLTINKLTDLGFLYDFKYGENLAKKLIYTKNFGLKRVIYELKLKGINQNLIKNILKNLNIDSTELAVNLINKKFKHIDNSFKSKQKIVRTLMLKGHNIDNIYSAMKICNIN